MQALIHDNATRRWMRFEKPSRTLVARTPDAIPEILSEVSRATKLEGLWAVGFLSYEAGAAFLPISLQADDFPLACFALYRESEPFAPGAAPAIPAIDWAPNISIEQFRAAVARIRSLIAAGDTYQVNFTFRLRAPFAGNPHALFLGMQEAQPGGHGAYLELDRWALCSASPELLFSLDGSTLRTRPMKGTARRGLWPEADRINAARLQASEKDRAENLMILDMARNDLGQIAETGSVRVEDMFGLERYPTLWQLTSTASATTHAGLESIFPAMFPAASITGAPKLRAMQIIAEIEDSPRRIYTGSIGFIAPGGRSQFNVAIRTVLVDREKNIAEYGVGAGIVWDSQPESEYRECLLKAEILTRRLPEFDLFETLLWEPEQGWTLLDRHIDRLGASADYFGWKTDPDTLREHLEAAAHEFEPVPQRVRLILRRDGLIGVARTPLAQETPWKLGLAREPVHSDDPLLYHKTMRREVYERALASCPGCDDALLWNERGELTESCIANVAVERNGSLVTPPVSCGLLPGTLRAELLETGRVEEGIIPLDEALAAPRIFLFNSLRGIREMLPPPRI